VLQATLADLQDQAACLDVVQRLSWTLERQLMVEGYLWWRSASQVPGFLDQVYEAANIPSNQTQAVNFRPLIRLIFSQSTRTSVDHWAPALRQVHQEYESQQAFYATDTVSRLCLYIKRSGGKTGLSGYHSKTADDSDWEDADQQWAPFVLDRTEVERSLLAKAQQFYLAHKPGCASVQVPALTVDGQGFSLVLMHRGSAAVRLLASSNTEDLIKRTLVSAYQQDFTAQPLTTRAIYEPLHLIDLPECLAGGGKLLDLEGLRPKREKGSLDRSLQPSQRRLLYRPKTRDFLLSYTLQLSSVVVRCRPKEPVIDSAFDRDLYLLNSVRSSVEQRLLQPRAFNHFQPRSPAQFRRSGPGAVTAFHLRLDTEVDIEDTAAVSADQVRTVTTNLNHPPLAFMPFHENIAGHTWWQVEAPDANAGLWSCVVDLQWVRDLAADFLTRWLSNYGAKCGRPNHRRVRLGLDHKALTIGFDHSKAKGYQSSESIALPSSAQGSCSVEVASNDFLFFMRQLADLNVVGDIRIQADDHSICLVFASDAVDFDCTIPTVDSEGVRHTKPFRSYHPVLSPAFDWALDLDDLVPDPDPKEIKQISENLTRLRAKRGGTRPGEP